MAEARGPYRACCVYGLLLRIQILLPSSTTVCIDSFPPLSHHSENEKTPPACSYFRTHLHHNNCHNFDRARTYNTAKRITKCKCTIGTHTVQRKLIMLIMMTLNRASMSRRTLRITSPPRRRRCGWPCSPTCPRRRWT